MIDRGWRDPFTRLLAGLSGMAVAAAAVDRHHVAAPEVAVFRAVNDLPDAWFAPLWPVMQLGNLAAVPVAATVAHRRHDDETAARIALAGTATWALSKLVKRIAQRGRPASLLSDVRLRGREQTGLGFLSGHAGVATVIALSCMRSRSRHGDKRAIARARALVPVVALTRIYVGAHLPLDVAAGAALGVTVAAAVDLALRIPQSGSDLRRGERVERLCHHRRVGQRVAL